MDWSASLTYATFADRVGETFDVRTAAGESVELALDDVTQDTREGGRGPNGEQRSQFSVVFHGRAAAPLTQGTYSFAHPQTGEFALFIVPISADADVIRYEAVFG
jgi:hypothetical protein